MDFILFLFNDNGVDNFVFNDNTDNVRQFLKIIMWGMYNVTFPIVDHCLYCRSKNKGRVCCSCIL